MEKVARKQFISFIVPLIMAMVVIVCFSTVIAKKRSEMNLAFAKKQTLEEELVLLRTKNMELHKLKDALVFDPVQVEKEAREQLGYGRPKEKFYKKYNFRVVNDEPQRGNKSVDAGEGIIKKLGLFGIFILIIVGVTGVFYATYWYECKSRRLHS
ncbi:MAG: septum formation initiator family protein [Candidatus Brocadiales bacterium]